MAVFVTGATGLLGSHLLYFLASKGDIVCALRRKQSNLEMVRAIFRQYPEGERLWQQVEWVEGDILSPATYSDVVRKSSIVYHCAALVSFSASDQGLLRETNLKGTEHIAALCLQYKIRLCYVSSIAALGDAQKPEDAIDEETPVIQGRAHSVYSQSKGESEKIVWKYIDNGLNAVIVCPSIILGAGMWDRSSAKLYFTAAKGIPFYTKGVSGYVDVRDVSKLMVRLAEDVLVKGERFVLNGGNYSYRELFATIARINGIRTPYIYLRPWMTGVIWRLLACWGKLIRKKMAFTRETARTSHHCSRYSNAKILACYPDHHFYTLPETIEHIRTMFAQEASLE